MFDTLLSRYRCSMLDMDLSRHSVRLRPDQVVHFWDHLTSAGRCLPVVVVSEKRGGGLPVEPDVLQHDLMGLAEVVSCSDEVAWGLGWYSWTLLCYDGQVRVYAPGLPADTDEARHRLWTFDDVSQLDYGVFLQLLRDECSRLIHYPQGRDALRVFSRVRGRVREHIRLGLSRENRQVYDEWAEEVSAKDDELRRWRERCQRLEEDNVALQERVDRLQGDKRVLQWRLESSDARSSEGYGVPAADGSEGPRSSLRTVEDVVVAVAGFAYVRVFQQVSRGGDWLPVTQVREFYDVLVSLNDCGPGRAAGILGSSEEDWMELRGIKFMGRESPATMNQYGDRRHFRDDDGSLVEMQPHIRVGRLRVHLCWSDLESRWLVGYFGEHLRVVGS